MSKFNLQRQLPKLKAIFDVRARLILVALILVVPLMLDRVRTLENSRASQIRAAETELARVANRGAQAQREMVQTVEGILKTAASVFIHASHDGHPCALLSGGFRVNLRGIGNISVIGKDGRVVCSTLPILVGLDITDRPYFHEAMTTRQFVLSDYVISKANSEPSVMAAYPTAAISNDVEAVVVTSVALNWLAELVNKAPAGAGMTVSLIDSTGTVLAAKPDIGNLPVNRAMIDQVMTSPKDQLLGSAATARSGHERMFASARVPDTHATLIVSIDKAAMLASVDRDIRAAYLQFGLVGLLVLIGAWFISERLILRPIHLLTNTATRFGAGDLSARSPLTGLPPEFVPLAQAFNATAARLAEREQELLNLNSKLSVLASVDPLSGLANRRGFDTRLNYEWARAEQEDGQLAMVMIDIDHFKLYNDTYGHLDGDACLTRVGGLLQRIANETNGFSARYGGEEFAMLLPGVASEELNRIGEYVRAGIEALGLPHTASPGGCITVSVGVALTKPVSGQTPLDLIEAADAALYMAKRRGRNTVVEHSPIRITGQITSLTA
ncbi:diguanylate cyclase [Afipia sp. P52-10]|uniref:sensor domain-containing diguanylate cyclase n=1 Tax=Afipia sp. P52-10 TaxID=1429916 RepID=UPI0003DEFF53|nr:diguanylate cyclase [Afipia sp. P52-10]ETR77799.1 diguanylate cyclase [Afipia sp. P52-10]